MTARRWSARPAVVVAVLLVAVVLTAAAPDPVPLGASRMWARVAMVAGATVLIARIRAVDLSLGATVGVAAVAGGVIPSLLPLPAVVGLPIGAMAGSVVGGVAGAVLGRAGRQLGALATLAVGSAAVAVLGALEVTGGAVGFHAVGLPTGGGDRADALMVGVVAVAAVGAASAFGRTLPVAAAAVATADPAVAAGLGRSPVQDAALAGGAAGALLGTGAVLLATVDGSVVPAAYGLEFTAALVLAAAVGGAGLLGPIVGTSVVWGPATLWPLVPIVGTAPVLVTMGPVALAILARRRGRGLVPAPGPGGARGHGRGTDPTPGSGEDRALGSGADRALGTGEDRIHGADGDRVHGPDRDRNAAPVLRVRGAATPAGAVHLEVAAGEVVAVVGPNGSGKSTLLARIGGQLPDRGTVEIAGRRAPRGVRGRSRAGVVRTWQRPPAVPVGDAQRLAVGRDDDPGRAALARLDAVPGAGWDRPGAADLRRAVGRRPRVALLDEPTDVDPAAVAVALAELRAARAGVVLVDHRPEVVAQADRVHHLILDGNGDDGVGS